MADATIDAETVRSLREGRGWTQADLAGKLGCSQPTVCRMEREGKVSRLYQLLIADLLKTEQVAA